MDVFIEEVHDKKALKAFIDFPYRLYAGNAYWVPPLRSGEMNTLGHEKNPAFATCEGRYWLAYAGRQVVGRIAGIINRKHKEIWGQPYMRFGWFDVIDDPTVTLALLEKVENWAREASLTAVHGPMGFTNLDHAGILVEGFEELATQAAGYNYAYYSGHMAQAGYVKDVDYLEYEIIMPDTVDPKITKLAKMVLKRNNLRLLEVKNKKELLPYARELFDMLGAEYKHLYGVVPLSKEQVDAYIKRYFGLIFPEFVPVIVDSNGRMVAFGLAMPALSKALQRSKGRLFPFGAIYLMRALKKNDQADLLLVAVAKEYQGKGVNAVLINRIFEVFHDFGIKTVESNPELESNIAVQAQWKHFERRQHKRRRIYIKHLMD
ncbi:MAG: GNAT family N-acetyltransferase [Anaerolineaceae bacterium]|nr:GNAT family N-acetyltransferase [Anaerolineaceae bacterium]